jgi:hypothetical protein
MIESRIVCKVARERYCGPPSILSIWDRGPFPGKLYLERESGHPTPLGARDQESMKPAGPSHLESLSDQA